MGDTAYDKRQDNKESVRAATSAALPANSLNAGKLTADGNGALAAQDGITLAVGEALLIKDEVAGKDNGIYLLSALGDGSSPWIFTRRDDFDSSSKVASGASCFVEEGTLYGSTIWQVTTVNPIALNTTALTWAKTSTSAAVAASAENTDGNMYKAATGFVVLGGTWTKGTPGGVAVLTRTASAGVGSINYEVSIPGRETAGFGRKLTGLTTWYSVNTADVFVNVYALIVRFNGSADNVAPGATVLAGTSDTHFDDDHDTAAKRSSSTGAPEEHRMEITIPIGTQAYLGADEGVYVQFIVDDTGGSATSIVVFKGMMLRYDEILLDTA